MNLTEVFLGGIKKFCQQQLPPQVFKQAENCFLDYLACAIIGSRLFNLKESLLIEAFQQDNGNAYVIGSNRRTSVLNAAMLNGISAHYVELDDGHRYGMMHAGAPIFSALLAINKDLNMSSYEFLKAAVVGYEVAIRLACAVQPGNKLRGFHATGTCGTIGVAMAIATAFHFDDNQLKAAFSAATTSAAGLLEMIEGDSELKPYNIGRAAMDGIMAAFAGKVRFKVPEDALGGRRGFLNVMTEVPNLHYLTDFDSSFAIEGIYRKPYAACRHLHPAIEGALIIAKINAFDWKNIKAIRIDTYHLAVFGHDHQTINGVNSAKMSIPYSVAVSLIKGSANMEDFSAEAILDQNVLSLAKKVSVCDNNELTALCPQKRVSIVNVTLNDGRVLSHRVDFPKGEPENPISPEELEKKFYSLAMAGGLTRKRCDHIIELIHQPNFNLNELLNECVQ